MTKLNLDSEVRTENSFQSHIKKKIIVIVPCFNEENTLGHFISAIDPILKSLSGKYQFNLLIINDGSADKTQDIIEEKINHYNYILFREFAFNAGHQSAIRAGIDVAEDYEAAIMMDADLQHPPEYIAQMLELWESSRANVVQMVRQDNYKEAGIIKYITSKGYYWVINTLSGLQLEYGASDFRLIDKSVIKVISHSPERDLFLRGFFSWLNVRRVTILYKPNKRIAGTSKYTARKMLNLAHRGILQFSEKPLQAAMSLGLFIACASFLYGVFLIIQFFLGYGHFVTGWASLMVIMLFFFGIQFILMGFIGQYLSHSISIQKQRPEYIIANEKLF